MFEQYWVLGVVYFVQQGKVVYVVCVDLQDVGVFVYYVYVVGVYYFGYEQLFVFFGDLVVQNQVVYVYVLKVVGVGVWFVGVVVQNFDVFVL